MNSQLEAFTGVTLADPRMLWLALPVLIVAWWRRVRGRPALRFAPGELLAAGLPRSWRTRLLPLPPALDLLALLLIVLALARPLRREPLPLAAEGIDLLLCLDLSSSMTATDLDPTRTRLDVARAAAAEFVAGRPHDRIGLLCFARYPDVVAPLTLDHDALLARLQGLRTVESDGPEDATAIGTAVARAAQLLRDSAAKSKVVILLTDGAENVATAQTPEEIAPLHAAQLCKELGVRVWAIAAGNDAGRARAPALAASDEWQRTGGGSFTARDAGAVTRVYAQIDALEKARFDEPRFRLAERFLPVLAVALALLVASRALQSSVLQVAP